MARHYRPSCGSEGADFIEEWCCRCERDRAFQENPDSGEGCPIVAATFRYEVDDPNYPKEWIEDDKGPRCTAFTTDPSEPVRCDKTADMFAPVGSAGEGQK